MRPARTRLFKDYTKRSPIALGDVIAGLWAVCSGPTIMKTKPTETRRRSHWWCRCSCGAEMFIGDSVLKCLRDTPLLPSSYRQCRACHQRIFTS